MSQSDKKNAKSVEPALDVPVAAEWADAWKKLAQSMGALVKNPPKLDTSSRYDPVAVTEAVAAVTKGLLTQPEKLIEIQFQALRDVTQVWASAFLPTDEREPVAKPERGDRRFTHQDWNENALFDQFKQNYLIASKTMRAFVDASSEDDPKNRAIVGFLVEQYLNAVAPTNFAASNPEVIHKTVETGGANLVSGFANLIEDVIEGKGVVKRRAPSNFVLGENLAATPGSVIYENDLMQLIQYAPTTDKVSRRPLLYVPPLVNKYYMIDLQPKSSLIRWMVEQGHTVFVISWVDPKESHRHTEVEDYVSRGVIEAMDTVSEITGEPDVDLFGFCMGGTLIALADAVLVARGEGDRIGTSTLIGSLVDFSDMRDWAGFIHESHVNALDTHIEGKGYIDKAELQQLFALVRSNDLIWSSFVDHYLMDREAPASDLLFWFEDGAHIPQRFLSTYNRKLLLDNHLTDPGKVELLGEKLDLGKVTAPLMIIGMKADHVSAWEAVYFGARFFGGPVEFVLAGSGHNAGVINPPANNKHGYWTNDELTDRADDWLAAAVKHEGSWWPHWSAWLKGQKANKDVPARKPGTKDFPVIEAAPGRFILAGND